MSSGSCVVIPTGQRPVWQWWQAPGLRPEGLVVLDVERRVAVERDQRGGPDVARVRAERQRLGHVHAAADPAGRDDLDLAEHADVLEPTARLDDGGERRDARCGPGGSPATRPSRPPSRRRRPRRRRLSPRGFTSSNVRVAPILTKIGTAVGRLAQLLDLDDHVVRAQEVRDGVPGSAGRRPGGRSRIAAISGDTFDPRRSPPVPGLAPWPIVSSMPSAWPQVVDARAVAARAAPRRSSSSSARARPGASRRHRSSSTSPPPPRRAPGPPWRCG